MDLKTLQLIWDLSPEDIHVIERLQSGDMLRINQPAIYDSFGEQSRLWETNFINGFRPTAETIHSLFDKKIIKRKHYNMSCEEFILAE